MKSSLLVFAVPVLSWTDPFDAAQYSKIEFTQTQNNCEDCSRANTPDAGTFRNIWGQLVAGESCTSDSKAETIQIDGDGLLDWVPVSSCKAHFETSYDFTTPVDFTSPPGTDSINFVFGESRWNFNLATLTVIFCDNGATCPSVGSLTLSTGDLSTATLPANCARATVQPSFVTSQALAFSSLTGASVDLTQVSCFIFGTTTQFVGNTMAISIVETIDNIPPTASSLADPHLTGFHGERAEISEAGFFSVYCDSTTFVSIRTETNPEGGVYNSEILFNLNGDSFEITTSNFEAMEYNSFLSREDSIIVVDTPVISVEIVLAQQDTAHSYLDLSFTAKRATSAGGILGRTLKRALSAEEFGEISSFSVSGDSHLTPICHY